MQNTPILFKAVIAVMKAVKGIDKSMTVGTGTNSYKGVSDKDVKEAVGKAMEENGLGILPIKIDPTVTIERWEETNNYGTKMKQSVFTEVKTKYLLFHESGESVEIEGYGHGVDTQDKAAGKATTYALKYALLYSFMVPTGKIDDADNKHSEESQTPPPNSTPQQITPPVNQKPEKVIIATEALKKEIDAFTNVDEFVDCRTKYGLTPEQKTIVTKKFNELFPNHKK